MPMPTAPMPPQAAEEAPPQVPWGRPVGWLLIALVVIVPAITYPIAGVGAMLIAISLCMIPLIFGSAMVTGGWPVAKTDEKSGEPNRRTESAN